MLSQKPEQIISGISNIKFQGAKVWNDIRDDIKLFSLKRFKEKFKSILIAKY